VTKRTRRIRLANQKKRHKATRLNLNLGDIFFSAKQKETALLLPKFTGAKLRQYSCTSSQKKTTAWIFQQNSSKIDGHNNGHWFCRVALPTIQPSEPGFWDGNLSNEKGALLVGWRVSAW